MKIKAFVLTAGLITFGVTNAAWAMSDADYRALPYCKSNLDGKTRKSGSKCTSKSYKFNEKENCTCPGDKPHATQKCKRNWEKYPKLSVTREFSCDIPNETR